MQEPSRTWVAMDDAPGLLAVDPDCSRLIAGLERLVSVGIKGGEAGALRVKPGIAADEGLARQGLDDGRDHAEDLIRICAT